MKMETFCKKNVFEDDNERFIYIIDKLLCHFIISNKKNGCTLAYQNYFYRIL